jgi:hypothetical protein
MVVFVDDRQIGTAIASLKLKLKKFITFLLYTFFL